MFSAQRALFGQSCSPLSVLGFYALVPQGWSLSSFPDEVAPSVLRSARLHFFRRLVFRTTNKIYSLSMPASGESEVCYLTLIQNVFMETFVKYMNRVDNYKNKLKGIH
jgi:hypothetical protein